MLSQAHEKQNHKGQQQQRARCPLWERCANDEQQQQQNALRLRAEAPAYTGPTIVETTCSGEEDCSDSKASTESAPPLATLLTPHPPACPCPNPPQQQQGKVNGFSAARPTGLASNACEGTSAVDSLVNQYYGVHNQPNNCNHGKNKGNGSGGSDKNPEKQQQKQQKQTQKQQLKQHPPSPSSLSSTPSTATAPMTPDSVVSASVSTAASASATPARPANATISTAANTAAPSTLSSVCSSGGKIISSASASASVMPSSSPFTIQDFGDEFDYGYCYGYGDLGDSGFTSIPAPAPTTSDGTPALGSGGGMLPPLSARPNFGHYRQQQQQQQQQAPVYASRPGARGSLLQPPPKPPPPPPLPPQHQPGSGPGGGNLLTQQYTQSQQTPRNGHDDGSYGTGSGGYGGYSYGMHGNGSGGGSAVGGLNQSRYRQAQQQSQQYQQQHQYPYQHQHRQQQQHVPVIESADGMLYHVQFKRSHRYYGLHPQAWDLSELAAQAQAQAQQSGGANGLSPLCKGALVIVEADRGVDVGVLRGVLPACEYTRENYTAGHRGRGFTVGDPTDGKRLLRLASTEEQGSIFSKVLEEEQTLQTARTKAMQRGLVMILIDAEFQLDRHKLTFFFEADRRVDFRDLVSELFSLYKTRIWMAQVDSGTAAALVRQEQQEQEREIREGHKRCLAEVLNSPEDSEADARWLANFSGLLPSPEERADLELQCQLQLSPADNITAISAAGAGAGGLGGGSLLFGGSGSGNGGGNLSLFGESLSFPSPSLSASPLGTPSDSRTYLHSHSHSHLLTPADVDNYNYNYNYTAHSGTTVAAGGGVAGGGDAGTSTGAGTGELQAALLCHSAQSGGLQSQSRSQLQQPLQGYTGGRDYNDYMQGQGQEQPGQPGHGQGGKYSHGYGHSHSHSHGHGHGLPNIAALSLSLSSSSSSSSSQEQQPPPPPRVTVPPPTNAGVPLSLLPGLGTEFHSYMPLPPPQTHNTAADDYLPHNIGGGSGTIGSGSDHDKDSDGEGTSESDDGGRDRGPDSDRSNSSSRGSGKRVASTCADFAMDDGRGGGGATTKVNNQNNSAASFGSDNVADTNPTNASTDPIAIAAAAAASPHCFEGKATSEANNKHNRNQEPEPHKIKPSQLSTPATATATAAAAASNGDDSVIATADTTNETTDMGKKTTAVGTVKGTESEKQCRPCQHIPDHSAVTPTTPISTRGQDCCSSPPFAGSTQPPPPTAQMIKHQQDQHMLAATTDAATTAEEDVREILYELVDTCILSGSSGVGY